MIEVPPILVEAAGGIETPPFAVFILCFQNEAAFSTLFVLLLHGWPEFTWIRWLVLRDFVVTNKTSYLDDRI